MNKMEKSGMGVGIITRGDVSIKWMTHMDKVKSHFPIGMFWKYIIVEGLSWAEARNEVVRQARKENFEWLLFIDDDVFLPEDAVQRLFSHQKEIINGVYWIKAESDNPVIFKKFGGGPYVNFPVDEVFEIAGSGLGCALIHMSVFDKFDEAGIFPYFKENWVMETESGQLMKCPIGEDHYFFYHAGKVGYKVWADSGVLCDHYDMKNKKFFPIDKVVRKYIQKKFDKDGRSDVVDDFNVKNGMSPDKSTVVFVSTDTFCGDSIEKGPLGGTETSVINVSRELAKKYNVHVLCDCNEPGVYDGVVYNHVSNLSKLNSLKIDSLVLVRNTHLLDTVNFKKDFGAKNVLLWTHDVSDSPAYTKLEDNKNKIDKIIVLTEWHKSNFMEKFSFLKDEDFIISGHGVNMNRFLGKSYDKSNKTLIYSSTPYRGLDILAEVFPKIKQRVPEARLKVFSSMSVYGDKNKTADDDYQWIYTNLKNTDGVEYYGSVTQDRLHNEFLNARVLAYPNTYPETFCITAIEAMATGTPIVTSDYAGLKNVVTDDVGFKIKGNPHSKEYKEEFVERVVQLLTDDSVYDKMHNACLEKVLDWSHVVKNWNSFLFADSDSVQKHGNINTEDYWNGVYKNEVEHGSSFREDKERFNFINSKLSERFKDDIKLLDIGCGTGEFTRTVRKSFSTAEIWGSDFSSVAIDYCRSKDKTIMYANHPVLNEEFEDDYFDVVSCQHVLEHIDEPDKLVDKMIKLTNKDGVIVLVLPVNDDEWSEHVKIYQLEDVEELVSKYSDSYELVHRKINNKRYKDGRPFEEAIIFIYKFKE